MGRDGAGCRCNSWWSNARFDCLWCEETAVYVFPWDTPSNKLPHPIGSPDVVLSKQSSTASVPFLRPVVRLYGQLYAALVRNMSGTLASKDACQGYTEDEEMMIKALVDVQRMVGPPVQANELRHCNIGLACIKWPQDNSVTYVLGQSATEKGFMQKSQIALFYNNEAKLAWSRDGSDRSLLSVHK